MPFGYYPDQVIPRNISPMGQQFLQNQNNQNYLAQKNDAMYGALGQQYAGSEASRYRALGDIGVSANQARGARDSAEQQGWYQFASSPTALSQWREQMDASARFRPDLPQGQGMTPNSMSRDALEYQNALGNRKLDTFSNVFGKAFENIGRLFGGGQQAGGGGYGGQSQFGRQAPMQDSYAQHVLAQQLLQKMQGMGVV